MIRSRVDLPPPDGPSRAVSWPVGMETLTSSRATKSPNFLVTPVMSMLMICSQFSVLGRSSATITRQAMLDEDEEEGDGVRLVLGEVLVLLLDHEGGRLGLAG